MAARESEDWLEHPLEDFGAQKGDLHLWVQHHKEKLLGMDSAIPLMARVKMLKDGLTREEAERGMIIDRRVSDVPDQMDAMRDHWEAMHEALMGEDLHDGPLENPEYLEYRSRCRVNHYLPRLRDQQKFCGTLGPDFLVWYGAMSDHARELEIENQWLRDQVFLKK